MSNRANRTSGHEIDLDSTDELPQLDPAALEAARALDDGSLSSGDISSTPSAAGGGELTSVFDTIRSLEANLLAKSEHMASQEQQIARLERQLRVREKAKAELQSQIAHITDARDGLAADVEARGATIARLKGDLAARAEQIRSLEQQRDAVEIDKVALGDGVRAREARIAGLEAELSALADRLNELEGRALSQDESGRLLKATIEQLEGEVQSGTAELAIRDERITTFATQLEQKEAARVEMAQALETQSRRLAEHDRELTDAQRQAARCLEVLQSLETRRRFHDDALCAFEQEIDIHLQHIAQLDAELTQRSGEMSALQMGLRERDSVINELRFELQNRDITLTERSAELGRLRAMTHESGGVVADLERRIKSQAVDIARLRGEIGERDTRLASVQEDLRARATMLRDREEEHGALRAALDSLKQQLGKRDEEVTDLITALQAEQKRVAGLEGELAARLRAHAELESRQRVQGEIAQSQARELENWKDKWSEVAAAMGEREARLVHLESDLRVSAAELGTRAERMNTLQKTIEDQANTLTALERELRDKAESLARFEGDLRAAEDSMLRLESQLRQKNEQQSSVQRTLDEQRGQIRHLQDTLATRDAAVARLEGELKASNEIIGNIQRDIRRLSGEEPKPTAVPLRPDPPVAEPEPVTRLFVRIDSETEVVHVINKKSTSIGRTDDNDIAIDTRYISRHHAKILTGPNATVIEDLSSTNGVFVNEHRVRRQVLNDGDIVMIGKTRFRFQVKSADRGG